MKFVIFFTLDIMSKNMPEGHQIIRAFITTGPVFNSLLTQCLASKSWQKLYLQWLHNFSKQAFMLLTTIPDV